MAHKHSSPLENRRCVVFPSLLDSCLVAGYQLRLSTHFSQFPSSQAGSLGRLGLLVSLLWGCSRASGCRTRLQGTLGGAGKSQNLFMGWSLLAGQMHINIVHLSQEGTTVTAEVLNSFLVLPWDLFPCDGTGRNLIKDNWEFLFIIGSDTYLSFWSLSLSLYAMPGFGLLHSARQSSPPVDKDLPSQEIF